MGATFLRPDFRWACEACQRSYWVCRLSQSSGEVLKASESLRAMGAEMPEFPLRRRDRVTRVTPRWAARSVTFIRPM